MIKASPEDPISSVEILGMSVDVPAISIYGLLTINETHRRDVLGALQRREGDGWELRLTCRPDDRLRLFMESRVDPQTPLAITPWDIPGIRQKGILDAAAASGPGEAA